MRHFPIFPNLDDRHVIVSGTGACAIAKLRLILKTKAQITVYGEHPKPQILHWAQDGKLTHVNRPAIARDFAKAALVYGANENTAEDRRVAYLGRAAGALVNIVDNLQDSQFITPAIVDRAPVTVAIGTEGAAPVLARKIKQHLEEALPADLGTLVGAGPGDPELLTLKARNLLHEADVVIYDHSVPPPILELARREAIVIETDKKAFGAHWKQSQINALMIKHATRGHHVVRLQSGDPDTGLATPALTQAGIPFDVVPGISARPTFSKAEQA